MNTAKDFLTGLCIISARFLSGVKQTWKYVVGGSAIVWFVLVVPGKLGELMRQNNIDPEMLKKGYRTTDTMDAIRWYDWSNGALQMIKLVGPIILLAGVLWIVFYEIVRVGKEHRSGRVKNDLCDHQ